MGQMARIQCGATGYTIKLRLLLIKYKNDYKYEYNIPMQITVNTEGIVLLCILCVLLSCY